MSRTTDALLFAILLVLYAIWMTLDYNMGSNESGLAALVGLLVGLVAVSGSLLLPLLSDDQSD